MVRSKKQIRSVLIILSILLLSSEGLHSEQMRAAENLQKEIVHLPSSVPDKTGFVLFSFFALSSGTETLALVAVYDDPKTRWPVDYLELYDSSGRLLAISWLDKFGILRTAVDRGLLEEKTSELEGILVLLPDGTPS